MGKRSIGQNGKVIDISKYPGLDPFLHRPVLYEPPLCTLAELSDSTYSFNDLILMNNLLDYKDEVKKLQSKSN